MRAAPLLAAGALVVAAVALAGMGMAGHMAGHMIAVALAAPLLALATDGRIAPALANPLAASVAELAVVWLWHLPAARAAAGHSALLVLVELACFLLAGTWLWAAVLAPAARARMAGVGALLLTSMHMTLLGALIGLAPRTLYPALAHAAPAGLSALQDQQLGGVIMLLVGAASYLAGALAVLGGVLGREARA